MAGPALHTQLSRIQTFLAVVDYGSYTKAADYLCISRAMASLHVKALEEALSVTLLLRNPRSISLTESGQALYDAFKHIVGDIDHAFESVMQRRNRITGHLRISTTSEYGEKYLLPLIPRFLKRYPDITIGYDTNSSLSDLVAEKLDLVVRLGSLSDSNFKSRKLADYHIALVAAPAFLERHPVRQPTDLAHAPWIANTNLSSPSHWSLLGPQGQRVEVSGPVAHQSNASSAIRSLALAGLGVAVLPVWLIEADLASGALQRLLPEHSLAQQPIHVVFPSSRHLPRKTRAFIDFLCEQLGPGR